MRRSLGRRGPRGMLGSARRRANGGGRGPGGRGRRRGAAAAIAGLSPDRGAAAPASCPATGWLRRRAGNGGDHESHGHRERREALAPPRAGRSGLRHDVEPPWDAMEADTIGPGALPSLWPNLAHERRPDRSRAWSGRLGSDPERDDRTILQARGLPQRHIPLRGAGARGFNGWCGFSGRIAHLIALVPLAIQLRAHPRVDRVGAGA